MRVDPPSHLVLPHLVYTDPLGETDDPEPDAIISSTTCEVLI